MSQTTFNVVVSTPSENKAFSSEVLKAVIEHGIAAMSKSKGHVPDEVLAAANSIQVTVSERAPTETSVHAKNWDAYANPEAPLTHQIDIDDQRSSNGQVFLTVGALEGSFDDMLSITAEVNSNPLSKEDDAPCMHVHFDADALAMSLFKVGDKILCRPESGVGFESFTLTINGVSERLYWIK